MLPDHDRMIETCRSVLSVLMQILDLLNYICMCNCWCVNQINYRMHGATINACNIRDENVTKRTLNKNISDKFCLIQDKEFHTHNHL